MLQAQSRIAKFLSQTGFLLALLFSTQVSVAENPAERQVLIYQKEQKTFYEYRQNGALVEIKVVPKKGKPYYLVPSESDGKGKMIRLEESKLVVPSWVIFEW